MEKAMKRDKINVNDRQLACARIQSQEGQDYMKGMAGAANFAWVNRSCMTFCTRQAFSKIFHCTPDDLDMHIIYDVSHNIAKIEEHIVEGKQKTLCVHRKGSTRAFAPHHPLIPVDFQLTGQPVLIGGTMGTCSYVLTGTEKGMSETFGTTCHGAGRALSRAKSRRNLDFQDVLDALKNQGISIRVASPKLVMEEPSNIGKCPPLGNEGDLRVKLEKFPDCSQSSRAPPQDEDGSVQEQAVAQLSGTNTANQSSAAYDTGILAATFGWEGKEFSEDVRSVQVQCYHNKEEQDFDLSWRPFKKYKTEGWYPVHVNNAPPCVINTNWRAECLWIKREPLWPGETKKKSTWDPLSKTSWSSAEIHASSPEFLSVKSVFHTCLCLYVMLLKIVKSRVDKI